MTIQIIDEFGNSTTSTRKTSEGLKPVSMAARMSALKKKAAGQSDDNGELWQPVAGDMLCGAIIGFEDITTRQCGDSTLMLVQDEFGRIVKTWLNSWLQSNLEALNADIGDLIALTFRGKMKSSKTGREFNSYSIVVDN